MTVASEKYLFIMTICMCIVEYVRISKRLSENIIRKTERVGSVKMSSHDPSFISNHFKFHFLWKPYGLVSDDFCNLYATTVFVRTNGQDAKNIKTTESLIDHFHCLKFYDNFLT